MANERDSDGRDPSVERAIATLRSQQEERQRNPAWEARFADRMFARAMDGMAVFAIGGLVVVGTNLARSPDEEQGSFAGGIAREAPTIEVTWGLATPSLSWFVAFGVAMAIFLIYEVGFTGLFGATPGKLVMRLQVVDRSSRKLVNPGVMGIRTVVWAAPISAVVLMWFVSVLYAWTALALAAIVFGRAYRVDTRGETVADHVLGTAVKDERLAKEAAEWAAEDRLRM